MRVAATEEVGSGEDVQAAHLPSGPLRDEHLIVLPRCGDGGDHRARVGVGDLVSRAPRRQLEVGEPAGQLFECVDVGAGGRADKDPRVGGHAFIIEPGRVA